MNISSDRKGLQMIASGSLVSISALTPLLLLEIVRRIVDAVNPAGINHFGSYAYGIPHKEKRCRYSCHHGDRHSPPQTTGSD
jgi:hypothetical protein